MASWLRTIAPAAPFVLGTGAAWLIGRPDVPLIAGIFVVGLTTIALGLDLHLRFKAPPLLLAGVFAAAGAGVTLHHAIRLSEVGGGEPIVLASIADAPKHPDATRFAFPRARPASEFSGKARKIRDSFRRKTTWSSSVAIPIVPDGWTRHEPVSAWLVCHDEVELGPSCSQGFPTVLAAAFKSPQLDRALARTAIDNAIAWHRLIEAAGAPMLVAATDTEGEIETMRLLAWSAPVAAFGLWLLVVRVFGTWFRPRA